MSIVLAVLRLDKGIFEPIPTKESVLRYLSEIPDFAGKHFNGRCYFFDREYRGVAMRVLIIQDQHITSELLNVVFLYYDDGERRIDPNVTYIENPVIDEQERLVKLYESQVTHLLSDLQQLFDTETVIDYGTMASGNQFCKYEANLKERLPEIMKRSIRVV